jgi:peptidoglycan hydrolase CwlO-like protein
LPDDSEIQELRDEISQLYKSVKLLTKSVNELTAKIEENQIKDHRHIPDSQYTIFDNKSSLLVYDASWEKLLALLRSSKSAMTAAELAARWGRSRSRTSEVLNKLAEEGHLVKFRDGRRIRFRTTKQ